MGVISAEAFEKGNEVFIVTEDQKVAMPVGEYILEDGRLVIVEEEKMMDEENYVTKDTFRQMEDKIQNLEDAIADLKADKVEAEKEDKKEELSAVKPIKHNPEASAAQKTQVQFGKGQFTTTL